MIYYKTFSDPKNRNLESNQGKPEDGKKRKPSFTPNIKNKKENAGKCRKEAVGDKVVESASDVREGGGEVDKWAKLYIIAQKIAPKSKNK